MAKYDFASAKRYIQMHSDLIESASLGMKEDWWWTAETVYKEGKFLIDLDDADEIAGISGSGWATPSIEVVFKDGHEEVKDCYIGNVGGEGQKPDWFALGCISQECQDIRDGKYILNNQLEE